MKINKPTFIAVIGIVAIGVAVVLFPDEARKTPFEKVVEFTYSRTQPCNAEYYNYGYSVGPLIDLIHCWKRDQGDFRDKLKGWIKSHSKSSGVSLMDVEIDELCRKVEIFQSPKSKFGHPILCVMKFSCDNSDVMELLTAAYKECMLACVERENIMSAERATLKEIGAFQRQEREVWKLKKELESCGLCSDDVERLKRAFAEAERVAIRFKAEWQAAKTAYREKCDGSLVFIERNNNIND